MADPDSRIRELEKRVQREPGSRSFVPLAEEYRRAGRLADAIKTLEGGLLVHEGYVAARIALARAHLEAGRIEDSVKAFSRALAEDPSNLVAAKALGDLHLSRGEPLEALKRYLRYRAISGDRRLDALIQRLQDETGPPDQAPDVTPAPPQPEVPAGPIEAAAPITPPPALVDPLSIPTFEFAPRRQAVPFDVNEISYKRPSGAVPVTSEVSEVPSRDVSLDALASAPKADEEIITRKIRLPEATWPFEPSPPAVPIVPPVAKAGPVSPSGRTLADLYFEQRHYPEAAQIYAELLSGDPSNDDLRRLRDEAERLAPGTPPPDLPVGDAGRERRLAKIRVLNEWLTVIQTGAARAGDS